MEMEIVILFAIIAVAIVLIVYGINQGIEAKKKMKIVQIMKEQAKTSYFETRDKLEVQRKIVAEELKTAGVTSLEMLAADFSSFLNLSAPLRRIRLKQRRRRRRSEEPASYLNYRVTPAKLRHSSKQAMSLAVIGTASLGMGALASVALYGSVSLLGTASTGTAIAALSGAAETNATLAWLGGGALEYGGLGIAGGQVVLGGVGLATVIAVAGKLLNMQADQRLEEAKKFVEEIRVAVMEMNELITFLKELETTARTYQEILEQYKLKYEAFLMDLEEIMEVNTQVQENWLINRIRAKFNKEAIINYRKLPEEEKIRLDKGYTMTRVLSALLTVPLLTMDGQINEESREIMQEAARLVDTF